MKDSKTHPYFKPPFSKLGVVKDVVEGIVYGDLNWLENRWTDVILVNHKTFWVRKDDIRLPIVFNLIDFWLSLTTTYKQPQDSRVFVGGPKRFTSGPTLFTYEVLGHYNCKYLL